MSALLRTHPIDGRYRRRLPRFLPGSAALFSEGGTEAPILIPRLPSALLHRRRQPPARGAGGLRAGLGAPPPRPLTWRGCIRFPGDRIHKAVVEALVPGALELPPPGEERWARRHAFETGSLRHRLRGTIGFRRDLPPRLAELLDRGAPLLLKAHYALWARAFAETDADPRTPVVVSLSRFCDDLGYARLANGAHRPAVKRQAAALLELLSLLELAIEFRAPDGRLRRLEGPVWTRLPALGEAGQVVYVPGPWFGDPAWRGQGGRVALAGAGLLALRPDRDRWAICAGAYLAALARMNGYRPLTLRVRTLLEKSGLARAERRNPARMREKLERALERLEEAGVLGSWDWADGDEAEPDMEAPAALAALAEAAGGWAERRVRLEWPAVLRAREEALAEARAERRRRVRRG